jgi:hypothetical protein
MKRHRTGGIESRLMVRPRDDIWSGEFREEMRRDRRFEGSLVLREAAALAVVVLVIVLRLIAT